MVQKICERIIMKPIPPDAEQAWKKYKTEMVIPDNPPELAYLLKQIFIEGWCAGYINRLEEMHV